MFAALDFWLEMGVDGLRLDAVPYLFEREGTNCENLPETHAFLKELRAHIDQNFSDRMLLAEANQWPEDAAAYFGDGDECHMNFHFPLMPRLFMAVEREDRSPIVDILEQTPILPPPCQWAIFLRNHDELTLEMVTDEERDYMYRTYALDSRARINLGIRRRLAPLMGNNRRKIELMNALLLSLPGTPILYYGDEIGMGDNYLPGRPQRRADAHAVERRPQRRLFARESAKPVSAGDYRPRVSLRIAQRRRAARQSAFAACGGRGGFWISASSTRHSDAAVSSHCIPTTRRCLRFCGKPTRNRCWSSPTFRDFRSALSWICHAFVAARRWNCLAARRFQSLRTRLTGCR